MPVIFTFCHERRPPVVTYSKRAEMAGYSFPNAPAFENCGV